MPKLVLDAFPPEIIDGVVAQFDAMSLEKAPRVLAPIFRLLRDEVIYKKRLMQSISEIFSAPGATIYPVIVLGEETPPRSQEDMLFDLLHTYFQTANVSLSVLRKIHHSMLMEKATVQNCISRAFFTGVHPVLVHAALMEIADLSLSHPELADFLNDLAKFGGLDLEAKARGLTVSQTLALKRQNRPR